MFGKVHRASLPIPLKAIKAQALFLLSGLEQRHFPGQVVLALDWPSGLIQPGKPVWPNSDKAFLRAWAWEASSVQQGTDSTNAALPVLGNKHAERPSISNGIAVQQPQCSEAELWSVCNGWLGCSRLTLMSRAKPGKISEVILFNWIGSFVLAKEVLQT